MYTLPQLPLSPRDFHDRIYRGEILLFEGLAPMAGLVAFCQGWLRAELAPFAPPEIHRHLDHETQISRFAELQKRFWKQPEVTRLWGEVFHAIGLDPDSLARDHYHLRFQPHQDEGASYSRARPTSTLAFHRDTWGSNIYQQVNWWAPIFEISAGRTVAFYPELWHRPVANTSKSYNLAEILDQSRRGGRNAVNADAAIPHLAEALDPASAVPVVIPPGALIAFSGAHAHAGVPNSTGLTRLSLETRTVLIDDMGTARAAPNIDGDAPFMAPGWFRAVSDGRKLSDLLGLAHIEPYSRNPE